MRKRRLIFGVSLLLGILGAVAVWDIVRAQTVIGPVVDFFAVRNPGNSQRTARVDATTSPNRTELGVDAANYFRAVGAAASGGVPSLSAIGSDSGISISITPKSTSPVILGGEHATGIAVFPAITYCAGLTVSTPALSPTPLRVAANDWALARLAAGAETINWTCDLNINLTRSTASKGIRIDALSIAYDIGVADLTTHSLPTLRRTTYANATANAIDGTGLTLSGTLSVTSPTAATQRGYLTGLTISSTAFQTTSNTSLNLDWQTVLQNTGTFRLYGVTVTYTHALY